MRALFKLPPLLLAAAVLAAPRTTLAQWPPDGRAVCTADGAQVSPALVRDDAGGAIIVWQDDRASGAGLYARRVLASGAPDPGWPEGGLALGAEGAWQTICTDGAGGAIVTWHDFRSGQFTPDIYAQRVLASGTVDPAWPPDGVALCTAAGVQNQPAVTPDGAGGAIIAWRDTRSGDSDIYAVRVLATGSVDPAWPSDGVALCSMAGSSQAGPAIVSDGAGGAIVAWADGRNVDADIYAQRVLPSGTVDPVWPANGRMLSAATDHQAISTICTDGTGGAIVAWRDLRNGNFDVYAQHVSGSGDVDPAWPPDGVVLCAAGGTQEGAAIVSDGASGAIITWHDLRPGSMGYDIYAQRVTASGGVAAVVAGGAAMPFRLLPPHPNPAGGGPSTIRLELPHPQRVNVDVFDLAGHRVRTLAREREFPAGVQALSWDGRDDSGAALPGGLYFVRMRAGDREETRRAVRLH